MQQSQRHNLLRCARCFDYETRHQGHMTRHLKFECPSKLTHQEEVIDLCLTHVLTLYTGTLHLLSTPATCLVFFPALLPSCLLPPGSSPGHLGEDLSFPCVADSSPNSLSYFWPASVHVEESGREKPAEEEVRGGHDGGQATAGCRAGQ